MRIDGNTLLFIFFIVFFVILPNNERDQGNTQYEIIQIQYAKDQLRYELDFLNNNITSIHNIPGNITGFKYTQEDLSLNHNNYETTFVKNESLDTPWLGYPIESKDYENGWGSYQSKGNVLPQSVLDTVNTQVWTNKTKVDESNLQESLYPWNLTSALRGAFGKPVSENTDSVLYLPRPKYYKQQFTFTNTDIFDSPDNNNNNMNEKRDNNEPDLVLPQYGDEFLNYSRESIDYRKDYVNFTDRPLQLSISQVYQYNHEWKLYNLDFKDSRDLSKNQLPMMGIYNVLKGQLFTFTQSSKFHPLFVAPTYFFNDNEDDFHSLKEMVNSFINKTEYIDTFNREDLNSWETRANVRCEYMGYFQVAKWQNFNARDMDMFERELANPMGRPIAHKNLPKIEITNGVLYSPDCGIHYQFNNFAGDRQEIALQKIRWDIIFFVTIPYMLQLFIFLKQMNFTNTPSRLNKVSRTTIDMLTLTDGTMAMTLFISAIMMDSIFVPLVVSSFFAFFLTLVFGIRYMSNIIVSQMNERIISWRSLFTRSGHNAQDGVNAETAQPGAEATTTTTAPAVAAAPATNVIPDESQLASDLNAKFMFKLFLSTFTMMTIASWSSDSRNVLEAIAIVLCNSYWLPQISRNFLIDISPDLIGLNFKWFVVGTSYVRLIPVVYIYGVKNNIFHHHQSKMFILLMFVYVTLQIVVIKLQHTVGGRNILPKVFMKHLNKYISSKKKYEYNRKLTAREVEEHGAVFSCPICMDEDDPIKVMVDVCDDSSSENDQHSASENAAQDHENQKTSLDKYMVTPCYHVFHTTCLVTWMNTKLQCPVCRQPLPPL